MMEMWDKLMSCCPQVKLDLGDYRSDRSEYIPITLGVYMLR